MVASHTRGKGNRSRFLKTENPGRGTRREVWKGKDLVEDGLAMGKPQG